MTCILLAAEKKHDLNYANPKFHVEIFVNDLLFCKPESGDHYRGADKSLARPGRKNATATKL